MRRQLTSRRSGSARALVDADARRARGRRAARADAAARRRVVTPGSTVPATWCRSRSRTGARWDHAAIAEGVALLDARRAAASRPACTRCRPRSRACHVTARDARRHRLGADRRALRRAVGLDADARGRAEPRDRGRDGRWSRRRARARRRPHRVGRARRSPDVVGDAAPTCCAEPGRTDGGRATEYRDARDAGAHRRRTAIPATATGRGAPRRVTRRRGRRLTAVPTAELVPRDAADRDARARRAGARGVHAAAQPRLGVDRRRVGVPRRRGRPRRPASPLGGALPRAGTTAARPRRSTGPRAGSASSWPRSARRSRRRACCSPVTPTASWPTAATTT